MSIRLPSTAFRTWLDQVRAGGDEAVAARALMVLGAAALGLDDAQREALRLLAADLAPEVIAELRSIADASEPVPMRNSPTADKWRTSGGQAADKRRTSGGQAADTTPEPTIEPEIDPFAGVGLDV